ncbi:hypothetical protein S245_008206, partial [Arachis hypogaea]
MAVKIYIVYYARSSCLYRLAEKIRTGAESVEGVKATLWK